MRAEARGGERRDEGEGVRVPGRRTRVQGRG